MDLKKIMRDIPDFPEKGVLFRDITPIIHNSEALKEAIDLMAENIGNIDFDYIIGPESRGFIFGMPLAYKLNKGFIPVRKEGKLPAETIKKAYSLEYGKAVIEIHKDAIKKGDKVAIVDDLLATGGTCNAIVELIEDMGGIIENILFFVELEDLKGRELFKNYNLNSILKY